MENSSLSRWFVEQARSRGIPLVSQLGAGLVALAGDANDPAMQASDIFRDDLEPSDIPPEWILEGAPQAFTKHVVLSPDGAVSAALWQCSAGKFEWHFGGDELVHILAGAVTVYREDGSKDTLKAGHIAYFPAGMRTVWEVQSFVRKLAVLRDNHTSFALRAKRKLDQFLTRMETQLQVWS